MALRLVQQGQGNPRQLVVLYLVGSPMDPELRAALGPDPAIIAYDDPKGEPLSTTMSHVTTKSPANVSDVILVGYSAGCQAVRRELLAGHDVAGVVAIDGTHASLPPLQWQLDVWRDYTEKARRGERLFVATCTQNTYVETDLPKAQRYSATLSILRQVTGFRIIPSETPAGEHDGALHVYGYASEKTDKMAHARQQTVVLPQMLSQHVKPWLAAALRAFPGQVPPQQEAHSSVLTPEERARVEQAIALSFHKLTRMISEANADEEPVPVG